MVNHEVYSAEEQETVEHDNDQLAQHLRRPDYPNNISVANSVGNDSIERDYLRASQEEYEFQIALRESMRSAQSGRRKTDQYTKSLQRAGIPHR